MIEIFCTTHALPDLACLAVNASGRPGPGYTHDWEEEKLRVARFDRESCELTQMEAFDGIFIVSTNLLGGFDQTAFRRVDLKLRFRYLCADKAWMLLCRRVQALGLPEPFAESRARVDRIRALTPGDYAAVVRRHRFHRGDSAEAFVAALEEECELKEDRAQVMGFV